MLSSALRGTSAAFRRSSPIFSSVRHKAAYEGDGRTTIHVLNQNEEGGLMIDAYATYGFRLNNGITVLGPIAVFPRAVFSWQVTESRHITESSLRLFKLLDPKIDLLVVGLESSERHLSTPVFRAARALGLNVEILPTEHACSTFNFLNAERRYIAAALIPPTKIDMNDDDRLRAAMHHDNLYNREMK